MHTHTQQPEQRVIPRLAKPNGKRKLSDKAQAYSTAYDKPPQLDAVGITKNHVKNAFQDGAHFMGVPTDVKTFIDYLFSWSPKRDWERGFSPIVWPTERQIEVTLGLSPTRQKAVIRKALDLGLILAKDSSDGTRWGKRDKVTGDIICAFGFNLAPLAHRIEEFRAARAAGIEEEERISELNRDWTRARNSIIQLEYTAVDYNYASPELHSLVGRALALSRMRARHGDSALLQQHVQVLKDLQVEIRALYETLATAAAKETVHRTTHSKTDESWVEEVQMDPVGSENGPPIYTYKESSNLSESIGHENGSTEFGKDRALAVTTGTSGMRQPQELISPRVKVPNVRAATVLGFAPAIRTYLGGVDISRLDENAARHHVRRAAQAYAIDTVGIGLPKAVWEEAQDFAGDWGAVQMAMIVASRDPGEIKSTPGGYFRGLLKAAKRGELHLHGSLAGLHGRKHGGGSA